MENSDFTFNSIFYKLEQYTHVSKEMYKYHTVYETIALFSILLVDVIFGFLVFIITLFFSVALALWLGDLFQNTAIGFLIIGFCYSIWYLYLDRFNKKPNNKSKLSLTK